MDILSLQVSVRHGDNPEEIAYKVARRLRKKGRYSELVPLIKRYGCSDNVKMLILWEARLLALRGDRTAFYLLEACNETEPDLLVEYLRKTWDSVTVIENLHLAGENVRKVFRITTEALRKINLPGVLFICNLPRGNYHRELCRLALLRMAILTKNPGEALEVCHELLRPTRAKLFRSIGRDIENCEEAIEELVETNRESLYWNDCVELALRGELTKALSLAGNSERLLAEIIKDYFLSGFIKNPRELLEGLKMGEFKRGLRCFLGAFVRRELKLEPIYLVYR
ncbi:hypothetical protein [Thermococcus camini]|uniref:Uncharacterized protein n=1 Tax=Thermococcus camini TaxID=2016373 RepID=A0A7G2D8S7_9EURY|nr:hypothetical protein [Thermococcus camini]CAD5244296.1 protein of unknown function [Thermococcus camini]